MQQSKKKHISIVTPCFNEEDNLEEVYKRVKEIFNSQAKKYTYDHIFIDNASLDSSPAILRKLAEKDKNVKVIFNARNFGHIRSPYYGLLQAGGDAVMLIVSDLQDPPELIPDFLTKWEEGFKVVIGVKNQSEESSVFFLIRKIYYNIVSRLSEIKLIKNFTGFGLYDKKVIEILKKIDDPYPYFRGLVCDIGFESCQIPYLQPVRKRGFTKNNFYTLYDMAMLGITNHSKIPLRLAALSGFLLSAISLLLAIGQLVLKLIYWNTYAMGISTVVIGIFFFASVQLFFIGIIGEYIGAIHTQVLKRPLVVEKERINFSPKR